MCPSRQDGKEAYERSCMVVKPTGLSPLILCGSSQSFTDVAENYVLTMQYQSLHVRQIPSQSEPRRTAFHFITDVASFFRGLVT